MQDPAMFNQMAPQFPEHEQLKCPRCDSTNTKFCYYNNYNLSQPRHFCKNCRRYWTKGGTLRNIPVGGGTRKNSKRPSNPKRQAKSGSEPEPARIRKQPDPQRTPAPRVIHNLPSNPDPTRIYGLPGDQDRKILEIPGSFSSLLSSDGHYGNLLTGLNPNGSGVKTGQRCNLNGWLDVKTVSGQDPRLEENYLGGNLNWWGGGSNGSGWPDLAIYTPSSTFQ